MDAQVMEGLGRMGAAAAVAMAAIGSALGTGAAGMAAIGAWKKCFLQSKSAPFILITFVGAPLSQTLYGMILMTNIVEAAGKTPAFFWAKIGAGFLGGIAMGISAWLQGRVGAAAADSMAETGKGFGNYLMALGIVETVALFVMLFIGKAIELPGA
jgi:V/A-type H+-transporting ATPase subunit K